MATEAVNVNYRKEFDAITFAASTATAYNEGDLMCWDTGTSLVRPIAAVADVDYMLGNSEGTNPVTYHKPVNYVTINCGMHTVKLKAAASSQSLDMFTPVYYSTDAQTFTTVSSGTAIGFAAINPVENGGLSAVTTVAGARYEIMLRKSYFFTQAAW